jgi:ABC-2 type transport system permease protein
MLDGAGPPQEVLNQTLRSIGSLTPLRHVVLLIQDPWLGFGWDNTELLVVIAFTAASAAIAFVVLRYPNALGLLTRRFARRAVA